MLLNTAAARSFVALRNPHFQPTPIATRIFHDGNTDRRTVVSGGRRSREVTGRIRPQAAPVLDAVDSEGIRVAEAIVRARIADGEVELVAPRTPGDVGIPGVSVAVLVRELPGDGDPVRVLIEHPPHLQPDARSRRRWFVVHPTRAFARVGTGDIFGVSPTGRHIVVRDAVRIRGTVAHDVDERVEVALRQLVHGAVAEAHQQVGFPVLDGQRCATFHDVHVGLLRRGHQAAVTERCRLQRRRVVRQADTHRRRRGQARDARRTDAPRGEHGADPVGQNLPTVAIRVGRRAHNEPRTGAIVDRGDEARAAHGIARAEARQLVVGDEGDVVPVVVPAGERALVQERTHREPVEQVHRR